jgi:protocatechuate 3,4-dioxygenase beta subunit
MNRAAEYRLNRREVLAAAIAAPAAFLNMGFGPDALAATQDLQPTPACGDADAVTPAQTPGPFFKPSSPERNSLLDPEMRGTRIVLDGYVRSTTCKPVSRALLDFWHADATGAYDNAGYRLRGHQFTDGRGKYHLETIIPGLYPGRTRHFHVSIQVPGRPVLITQLYFPGEAQNRSDGIFNPKLQMSLRESGIGKLATFDFVLRI